MKKWISMLLVLSVALGCAYAAAEGMDVNLVSAPPAEEESEPVSLDDFKINAPYTIENYGELTATSFTWQDKLSYATTNYAAYYSSGVEAEYAILRFDILNLTQQSTNYLANVTVKAVYDDVYEYGGWYYQFNFDDDRDKAYMPEKYFNIDPMYVGHYCFGCTLPNAVVDSKKPLKLVITIDDNEITYYVRK